MFHYIGSFKEWAITSIAALAIYGLTMFEILDISTQLYNGLRAQAIRIIFEKSRLGAQAGLPPEGVISDEACADCRAPREVKELFRNMGGGRPIKCDFRVMVVNSSNGFQEYFPVGKCVIDRYEFTNASART